MIRVLLVDDDAMVRAGLTLILGGSPVLEIVGEAPDGAAGVAAVSELQPDVVLMDIRMPVLDGVEATRRIRSMVSPPHVIVLTTFDADDLVVRALQAGASGFLLKDTRPEQLVGAIEAVCAGEPFLSPSVTRQLVEKVTAAAPADPRGAKLLAQLTEREHEVAVLLSRGLSNADIAADLFMSVPTVKAHVSRILGKLGVDNRVQAAILIHETLR
ncbi:response regulator transcription factor [Yimella sp. cx-51]|uniref:response regulator n=1 Tax=Yimella sp. cx-51 TaxID=2770551 RepID=UPI00165D3E37|nr:response regulator transcription factor [Yimella sp. cx-51]MBC9956022.1 response regulator transcription factor [Yimella sp. cx-51]QTH37441.1 response regulator transcription factor [Yimella sp. cx-51]